MMASIFDGNARVFAYIALFAIKKILRKNAKKNEKMQK